MALYPNPSEGAFAVDVPGTLTGGAIRLEVFNTIGQAVYTHYVTETTAGIPETITVSLPSATAAGTYLVRVQAGNQTFAERMIVQH